ncbi:uncharacterized protein B0T23DRAFT_442834 [Neurospora hispaniola]|uniref:Uncharacterized protein n=1 Tax=Neurospora hispaniola TaxID=588809 RepID=A0AAJ0I8L4_9PEZI|nr:hypothetical protein B0T23DRAFT_442834 [Neurospora hispaniola]
MPQSISKLLDMPVLRHLTFKSSAPGTEGAEIAHNRARPSSKRAANTTKPDSAVKKSTRRSPKTKDEIPDSAFPPPQRQQLLNGYFGFIGPARAPPTGPSRALKRSKKDTVELGSRSIKQLFNAIPPTIIISDSEEDVDSSSSAASATPTLNRLTDIRAFTTLVWEAGLQQIEVFKCPSKHDNVIRLVNDKDFVPSFELGHPDGLVKPGVSGESGSISGIFSDPGGTDGGIC